MAYNTLSGTVVANRTVVFKENGGERDEARRNMVRGEFHGDGTYIENVARVVADGVNDYVVTVGNTQQSLVGEQNLRFNGSRLYINGDVTASAVQLNGLPTTGALLNSFLALDSSNNIVLTSSFVGSTTVGQGPTNSIQLHSGSGYISGSENLLFDSSTSELTVVGSVTSSYLNLDSIPQVLNSQDTYLVSIDGSGNVFKSNPTPFVGIDHAIRFEVNNTVTSSGNFTYNANANLVQLSGDLVVTGTIQANTFDVIHTNVTEMDASGSTNFGNSNDDNHIRTGSFAVMSSSAEQFKVDVINNVTSISTGVVFNRVSIASNYIINKSNYIIGVDSTGGSVTVTLPDASTLSNGQVFVVKDEGGDAFNNNIFISASGSQKINNTNTAVLQVPYVSIQLYCDGTNKFFIF
jgi:hypothetical protein